jgi:hypothetical protein
VLKNVSPYAGDNPGRARFKQVPFAICLSAATAAVLALNSPTAHAAQPVPSNEMDAAACRMAALTDVVDRTNRVSGGGSINCGAATSNSFGIFVELYRGPAANRRKVASAANSCTSTPGCFAAVEFADTQPGRQRFQVKVIFRGTYQGVRWGNVIYH